MVSLERPEHLVSFNDLQSRGCNRGGGPVTNIVTSKTNFTEKFAWSQNGEYCLLASLRGHGEFHAAALNVHECLGDIALGENNFSSLEAFIACGHFAEIERNLGRDLNAEARVSIGLPILTGHCTLHG